jgi:crotonobetainyl-CoA:carnitine CoA-transferase CaiB-like acyl-CoA transferase
MRALEGLRVVDLTRHMAGPFATLVLSDHGADVVKVESLPDGDASRRSGSDYLGSEAALFLLWNRGKRSLAVDLRSPDGVEIVRDLAREADVLVENYRPGVADRIGLGYRELSALNERLVYCSVSAFGPWPALASAPGTDPVVQATSGIMSVTGEPGTAGALVGVPVADFTGAMHAVQGVLLALLARERTGRGQLVQVPMLLGMLSMLSTRLGTLWASGRDPEPYGSAHSVHVPYQVFRTADGHVMAGAWGGESWPRFCRAVERPDLIDDARFADGRLRNANRAELIGILEPIFAARDSADWERRFGEQGALFAPVLKLSQILAHPQVADAGFVQSVTHPRAGEVPQLAPPILLEDTPGAIGRPPPLLGEHTDEVLGDLGYAPERIARLRHDGVLGG